MATPYPELSFEALLARARSGDARAREELFHRSLKRLDKWAAHQRRSPKPGGERPSDIAQEVGLLASRAFSQFKGTTERQWFAWLKEIRQNHEKEARRNAHREKHEPSGLLPLDGDEVLEIPSPLKSPSQVAAHQENWRRMLVYVYQLPDDQREAVTLCHLKELPVAEVARRMEKTESAVAGLLLRGWRQVRARMKEEPGPEDEQAPRPAVQNEVEAALLFYLRRRGKGEQVDLAKLIAEHPACADELRDMIAWIERLQALRPTPPKK